MKKTLFVVIIILCSISTYAQTDSSKYTLTRSERIVEVNSIETNILLSHQSKSQFVNIECTDNQYLYFYTSDNILFKLPLSKINIDSVISVSKIDKPSINNALTKFSNESQIALVLPILGALAAIPLKFPNGYYAIGGATAISFILNMSSYRHLKRFARYSNVLDFNQW